MRGFSIIEILIVFVVIIVIATMLLGVFASFERNQNLQKQVKTVVSLVREARSKTMGSINDRQYGVHLEAEQAQMFYGNSYSTSTVKRSVKFPDNIEITNISLSDGGQDIIFSRPNGFAISYGSTTLANSNASTTIYIKQSGEISSE